MENSCLSLETSIELGKSFDSRSQEWVSHTSEEKEERRAKDTTLPGGFEQRNSLEDFWGNIDFSE